jgi:hypothetical protein
MKPVPFTAARISAFVFAFWKAAGAGIALGVFARRMSRIHAA